MKKDNQNKFVFSIDKDMWENLVDDSGLKDDEDRCSRCSEDFNLYGQIEIYPYCFDIFLEDDPEVWKALFFPVKYVPKEEWLGIGSDASAEEEYRYWNYVSAGNLKPVPVDCRTFEEFKEKCEEIILKFLETGPKETR